MSSMLFFRESDRRILFADVLLWFPGLWDVDCRSTRRAPKRFCRFFAGEEDGELLLLFVDDRDEREDIRL